MAFDIVVVDVQLTVVQLFCKLQYEYFTKEKVFKELLCLGINTKLNFFQIGGMFELRITLQE